MKRFWSKVKKTSTCWIWIAARDENGYGRFGLNGKNVHANRVSYILENGPIGKGIVVRHTCDRPACVNPHHLRSGSQKDNVADMISRKRHWAQRSGMPRGERSFNVKLSSADVLNMRLLKKTSNITYTELGERFGVRRETAFYAVKGKNWGHL